MPHIDMVQWKIGNYMAKQSFWQFVLCFYYIIKTGTLATRGTSPKGPRLYIN